MEPRRYRLNRSTLGVSSDGEKKTCLTVPGNEIIQVELSDVLERGHTIEVKWGNHMLTMFTEDILDRGILVNSPSSGMGSGNDLPFPRKLQVD